MVKVLLEVGADQNKANVDGLDGDTLLRWAAERGNFELVKLLLKNGADHTKTNVRWRDSTVSCSFINRHRIQNRNCQWGQITYIFIYI